MIIDVPEAGGATADGIVPTFKIGQKVDTPSGNVNANGIVPTFKIGRDISTPTGSVNAEGIAPSFSIGTSVNATICEATIDLPIPTFNMGINISCDVGDADIELPIPTFKIGVSFSVPIGTALLSAPMPYLGITGDITMHNFTPRKVSPNYVNYIKFDVKNARDSPFLINEVSARMNCEDIPATVTLNGATTNKCQLEVDTNHLPSGWKKLDIVIRTDGNSNQFRRYIRVL